MCSKRKREPQTRSSVNRTKSHTIVLKNANLEETVTNVISAAFGSAGVIREDNLKRTHQYIEKGIEEGAAILCDGRQSVTEDGYFVGPTSFDHVTTEMTIWKEEIFLQCSRSFASKI